MLEINLWAALAALASSMVVGAIWYTPKVFGNYWMKIANVTVPENGKGALAPLLLTLLVSAITATVLAAAATLSWHYFGGSYLVNAVLVAIVGWAGLTAARFVTHDAFEGRPAGLTLLNIAHEFVTLVVMAVIIGVWPPSGIGLG